MELEELAEPQWLVVADDQTITPIPHPVSGCIEEEPVWVDAYEF